MIRLGITGQAGFIGTHLFSLAGTRPDTFERVPFDALLDRCLSGDLRDGKTVAGVLKVYALRTRKKEEK